QGASPPGALSHPRGDGQARLRRDGGRNHPRQPKRRSREIARLGLRLPISQPRRRPAELAPFLIDNGQKTTDNGQPMSDKPSRIAIIGAGSVGATIAYACLIRGIAKSIALYDTNDAKVNAEVLDLN